MSCKKLKYEMERITKKQKKKEQIMKIRKWS